MQKSAKDDETLVVDQHVSSADLDAGLDLPGPTRARQGSVWQWAVAGCLRVVLIASRVLSALLLAALLVIVLIEVAARELTKEGAPAWTHEIALYVFVWLALLSVIACTVKDSQPALTTFINRIPIRIRVLITGFVGGVSIGLFALLARDGRDLVTLLLPVTSPASGISQAWLGTAVPVGFIGIALAKTLSLLHQSWQQIVSAVAGAAAYLLVVYLTGSEGLGLTLSPSSFYPVLFGVLVVVLLVGMPIGESLLAAAYVAYVACDPTATGVQFADHLATGLNTFTFAAIPLFLLAGTTIAVSGHGTKMLMLVVRIARRLPGAAGVADVVASAIFADLSGSATADTVAVGRVMIPEMQRQGYSVERSSAIQAVAGTLGVMFPPSIATILYATVANVSVAYMFAATLLPALLVAFSLCVYCVVTAPNRGRKVAAAHEGAVGGGPERAGPAPPAVSARRSWTLTVLNAIPGFGVILVVLGGLFAGIFTAEEAGAVAAIYAVLIGLAAGNLRTLRGWGALCSEVTDTIGRVCFVILSALTFGWLVVQNFGPQRLVTVIGSWTDNRILTLLLVMVFLVIVHEFMDASATIVAIIPLLVPLVQNAGVNLAHFGVLVDLNSAIGLVLPPVGLCLFLVASISGAKIESTTRAALPLIGILVADLAIVLFIPDIAYVLPHALGLHG